MAGSILEQEKKGHGQQGWFAGRATNSATVCNVRMLPSKRSKDSTADGILYTFETKNVTCRTYHIKYSNGWYITKITMEQISQAQFNAFYRG